MACTAGNQSRTATMEYGAYQRTSVEQNNDESQVDSELGASSEDSDQEEIDESVIEDMNKLEERFEGFSEKYRLIRRIGEGTFSTVYKAEDLLYDKYYDYWDSSDKSELGPEKRRRLGYNHSRSIPAHEANKPKHPRYVALKKIYVTSSPLRVQNELELLLSLRGCPSVCPIITAFRHHDQVVAVLPYFPHADFRDLYRSFLVEDMRLYLQSLFAALASVHQEQIIHRDIKPTNFLYNPIQKRGVLVDFGLAESDEHVEYCKCCDPQASKYALRKLHLTKPQAMVGAYPKNDSRPSRRANRAGTRGFRAPEVLFKCPAQTTKIDIWSVGVILLTLLGRRFPFFHSVDDVDAMIELTTLFGIRKMRICAALHGQAFECTIPTIEEAGYTWERIVLWSNGNPELSGREKQAIGLLSSLLELDPNKRLSAEGALAHDFFTDPKGDDFLWEENDQVIEAEKTDVEDFEEESDEVQFV